MPDNDHKRKLHHRHRRGWDGHNALAAAVLESASRNIKSRCEFMELAGPTEDEHRENLAHLCLEWRFATTDTVYHQLLKIDPRTINRRLQKHTTPEQRQRIHDAFDDTIALSRAMDDKKGPSAKPKSKSKSKRRSFLDPYKRSDY